MTETQSSPPPGPEPQAPRPGVDREHLRNYERLHRSVTDRKVAGVAGGLGRHLNIDPTILRVLFVVLCFFGGAGFLLYGAAWLLVPEDGREDGKISTSPSTRNVLLIAAGVVAALLMLGDSWHGIGFPWPLFLVGIGVVVYLLARDKPPAPSGGGTPGPTYAPVYGPPTAEQQTTAYAPQTGGAEAPPPWLAPTQQAPAYQPPPARRGAKLFGPTLALVAVALGVLGLYDASGGGVTDGAYPALALAVVGVMLVVGAFVGRAGGLIFLGIVSALALAATSIGSAVDYGRGSERVVATPTSASSVKDTYFVPNGRVELDLTEVRDPSQLDGRSIEVGARAGEVVVVLPRNVRVDLTAEVSGPGEIDLPDHNTGGLDNHLDETFGTGPTSLDLRAHLFAGHIEVRTP